MKKEIGYKGFNVDENNRLYCNPNGIPYYFEVGKTYEIIGQLKMCNNGFHYCRKLNDIDEHYNLKTSVICEIQILGSNIHDIDGKKSCASKIKILRILTKEQVWTISNTGKDNTGFINSGNYNSGNRNSGDYNSGNCNSGYYNSGNCNSGYYNSGDYNSGNCNSGYYNSGVYSNGFFNTKQHKIFIFDMPTKMTTSEFKNSTYFDALTSEDLILTEWINYTEKEKAKDKAKELIGGYLKKYEYKEACQIWWNKLTKTNKQIIQSIPNFNKDIFFEITGIKL